MFTVYVIFFLEKMLIFSSLLLEVLGNLDFLWWVVYSLCLCGACLYVAWHGLQFLFCLISEMNRHLKDFEIEEALQDMFSLPDDPDKSEDNLESDDECPNFSTIRLQQILEGLDEPRPVNLLLDNIPMPSPSSVDEQIDRPCSLLRIQEVDNNLPSSIPHSDNFSPILDSNRRITRPRRVTPMPSTSDLRRPVRSVPVLPVIEDSSDSDQSDTEEVLWKKKLLLQIADQILVALTNSECSQSKGSTAKQDLLFILKNILPREHMI